MAETELIMTRHAPRIAAFALASMALGSILALATPTDLRPARNSKLEQLSEPQIAEYPGANRVIAGQDSYPVVYSPQYLAVAEQAERARLKQSEMPPLPQLGYDQPDAARDAAIAAQGTGEVTVRGGAPSTAATPDKEPGALAANEPPEG
jgi:hypothetical protein